MQQGGGKSCERLIFFESGRTAGCFSNGSVVLLEANGGSMAYSSVGDGQVIWELTRFAQLGLRRSVQQVLDFRNRLAQVPYISRELLQEGVINVGFKVSCIRWPLNPKMICFDDEGISWLNSLEGAAVMTLASDQKYFEVEVLTPVPNPLGNTNEYTSVKQLFFLDEPIPSCYKRPLELLLTRKGPEFSRKDVSESLPRTPFDAHEPFWPKPKVTKNIVISLCSDPQRGVPVEDKILVEWKSNEATFRMVRNHMKMEICINADGSLLELSKNRFFQHHFVDHLPEEEPERIYAPDGVPRVILCRKRTPPYQLRPSTDHAANIMGVWLAQSCDENAKPEISTAVNEQLIIKEVEVLHGVGKFTYLSNDSVKVLFEDNTMLHSDPGFNQCQVVFGADASSVVVTPARPLKAAQYVRKAAFFLKWARLPRTQRPTDRFQDLDTQRNQNLLTTLQNLRAKQVDVDMHLQRLRLLI